MGAALLLTFLSLRALGRFDIWWCVLLSRLRFLACVVGVALVVAHLRTTIH
jgi:hypothetical protein